MRKLVTVLVALMIISSGPFAPATPAQGYEGPSDTSSYRLSPAQARSIIAGRAREVIRAIKYRNMQRLASFVHPQKGVLFSPYVDVESKKVLMRGQIVKFYRSRQKLVWGTADASGDPIRLTFREYLKSFIYQRDLLNATRVNYNTFSTRGLAPNKVFERYPRAIIVEYYHEGITAPQGGAMDWQSLWLVFEKTGNTWYLVAIVNDEHVM